MAHTVARVSAVALCEEGVDRNDVLLLWKFSRFASPSAKRAWIEIILGC